MWNNEDRAVGPPVFVPQQHPEVKTLGRKSIHNFLRDMERNPRRERRTPWTGQHIPASYAGCIGPFWFITYTSGLGYIRRHYYVGYANRRYTTTLVNWTGRSYTGKLLLRRSGPYGPKVCAYRTARIWCKSDANLSLMSLFADYKTFLRQKKMENLID